MTYFWTATDLYRYYDETSMLLRWQIKVASEMIYAQTHKLFKEILHFDCVESVVTILILRAYNKA